MAKPTSTRLPKHGANIRAPRHFEQGEAVFFIQKIYGTSMCFGKGIIAHVKETCVGSPEKRRTQYTIEGYRIFYHEGTVSKDKGRFESCLGSTVIVIVPRNAKTLAWFSKVKRDYEKFLAVHSSLLQSMRI